MFCPVTAEQYQVALALRTKLQAELDWLRIASKSYRGEVFRRLVDYSATRLQWVMTEQMHLGPSRVRFQVGDADSIRVSILWAVRPEDAALSMAWKTVMGTTAQA
jgi:hypothetical protein